MYPWISLNFIGWERSLPTQSTLIVLCFFLALWACLRSYRNIIPENNFRAKSFAIVSVTTAALLLGARLFHVFIERPEYFKAHPAEILSRADGMTLYGGFILAVPLFFLLTTFLYETAASRYLLLSRASLVGLVAIGVLRVGCFLEGCCWGRLCPHPWAVRYYNESAATPHLGLPLHPTQLYESLLCGLGAALIYIFILKGRDFRRRDAAFSSLGAFFIWYSFTRFVVEFFRGDSYRGVHVLGFMSTSQVISLVFGSLGLIIIWRGRQPAQLKTISL